MVMSAGEKVLELVELHREQADLLERRGARDQAEAVRELALEYERVVKGGMPEWIPLGQAQAVKGWSSRWWRERCQELAEEELARKSGGRWEVHRQAFQQIPSKGDGGTEITMDGSIEDVADRLARET